MTLLLISGGRQSPDTSTTASRTSNLIPPDQPRYLAFFVLAIVNIVVGLSFFAAPKTAVTSNVDGPLWLWGFLFIAVGLFIFNARYSNKRAFYVSLAVFAFWIFYSALLFQAVNTPIDLFNAPHSPIVTIRSPIYALCLGLVHVVLIPYWRKPR